MKKVIRSLLKILNRLAPYAEVAIAYYAVTVYRTGNDKSWTVLLFLIPIAMAFRLIKWEWRCFQSRNIIRQTARNKRVQGFSGPQGAGKTSFMLFSLYTIKPTEIYTNFPCKIRGRFTNRLDTKVLNIDHRIPDGSACAISEATMLFHNRLTDSHNPTETANLYSQQLHQQIIRHIYDGNLFYDSVDLTRLPQMLKDNVSMTNYMLGQGNVTLSFIISPLLSLIAKPFGVSLSGNIRFWDLQQLEKIPEQGYTFDLSTQEKTTDMHHFANLLKLCTWDSIQRFDYDDRFLRGLYAALPEHAAKQWATLEFADADLREIGYGFLLDFFAAKITAAELDKAKERERTARQA